MTTRAIFSLTDHTMARFRSLVPNRERSRLIEELLRKELDQREREKEKRLEDVARLVESHADFAEVRLVTPDVNGVAGEVLE